MPGVVMLIFAIGAILYNKDIIYTNNLKYTAVSERK